MRTGQRGVNYHVPILGHYVTNYIFSSIYFYRSSVSRVAPFKTALDPQFSFRGKYWESHFGELVNSLTQSSDFCQSSTANCRYRVEAPLSLLTDDATYIDAEGIWLRYDEWQRSPRRILLADLLLSMPHIRKLSLTGARCVKLIQLDISKPTSEEPSTRSALETRADRKRKRVLDDGDVVNIAEGEDGMETIPPREDNNDDVALRLGRPAKTVALPALRDDDSVARPRSRKWSSSMSEFSLLNHIHVARVEFLRLSHVDGKSVEAALAVLEAVQRGGTLQVTDDYNCNVGYIAND